MYFNENNYKKRFSFGILSPQFLRLVVNSDQASMCNLGP